MADDGGTHAWSDSVEDLIDQGDVDGAILFLEAVVSKLETPNVSSSETGCQLQLSTALSDLARLHSEKGFSLKADELRSRAILIRARASQPQATRPEESDSFGGKFMHPEENGNGSSSNQCVEEEDDWEAIADRSDSSGEVLLSAQHEKESASVPSKVCEVTANPRRRGRGSFLYKRNQLYSDQPHEIMEDRNIGCEDKEASTKPAEDVDSRTIGNLRYGTSHAIVLYDFLPNTRTIQLEKLFDSYIERWGCHSWINDTTAIAVFRTPFAAHEALSTIRFPFKARQFEDDDPLLDQIFPKDLEPPFPRPKTSMTTAQRLIAHGMGFKPFANSIEFRKQEEARKNRILERQAMKDEAWGPD
ncbi:hypothetical protein HPP92_002303 [Vanilla planifolia]|uniref:Uncharacterized protein n=1 Tax=Vanilla planifolia TaxID=51239 RepID=A0A835S9H9_VANPL|nr:hypothetical protein HPP92_002303 [Vanilla planifolia]